MKPISDMSHAELAAYIQRHLAERGIDVILTGGSAVSFYSGDLYVSKDIDLVIALFSRRPRIERAMMEIGFSKVDRYYEHPDTEFLVEFPGGPASVGEEQIRKIHSYELHTGTLRVISPTDCVKDRLAAYYYFNDQQSIKQAKLVIQNQDVDLDEVSRWSEAEGKLEEFNRINHSLMEE
jgi:hypothetical protein